MIARVEIALPECFAIPANHALPTVRQSFGGYEFEIRPPFAGNAPMSASAPDDVKIEGVQATIAQDLRIDFFRPTFDRTPATQFDPPLVVVQGVLDHFLVWIRALLAAPFIRPLSLTNTSCSIAYLNDDGSELASDGILLRKRIGRRISWRVAPIGPETWTTFLEVPFGISPPPWNAILLDAEAELPEIGTPIALAMTALEVFIAATLEDLARRVVAPHDLWRWVSHRDHFLKEPSTGEQFDSLLRMLSGNSLKSDARLWELFSHLKDARNSFVHEGVAKYGKEPGILVTADKAAELVRGARAVINKVQAWLPADMRWSVPFVQLKVESMKRLQ